MSERKTRYSRKKQHELKWSGKAEIRKSVREGKGDVYELAEKFGCVPGQIAGIKSAMRKAGVTFPKTIYEADHPGWPELEALFDNWALELMNKFGLELDDEEGRIGQGRNLDPEQRRAVAGYAMMLATRHLEQEGWKVRDVSRSNSYDLECVRPGSPPLHVEVKGTTLPGPVVILTKNEVAHAREQHPNVALFIVHGIQLSHAEDGTPVAGDGTVVLLAQWSIDDDGTLEAVQYRYALAQGDRTP